MAYNIYILQIFFFFFFPHASIYRARARTLGHGRGASRSLDWENGRLARSMDSPYAAHATDGTLVCPVGALRGALTGKAAILAAAARRDASPHRVSEQVRVNSE